MKQDCDLVVLILLLDDSAADKVDGVTEALVEGPCSRPDVTSERNDELGEDEVEENFDSSISYVEKMTLSLLFDAEYNGCEYRGICDLNFSDS